MQCLMYYFICLFIYFGFSRQVSLCGPGWPGLSVAQAGLELTDLLLRPASRVLGSQVCTTVLGNVLF